MGTSAGMGHTGELREGTSPVSDTGCDDDHHQVQYEDRCGVCGGDDSSCLLFADGFETGDPSAWGSSVG